jgi:hypothetical protein
MDPGTSWTVTIRVLYRTLMVIIGIIGIILAMDLQANWGPGPDHRPGPDDDDDDHHHHDHQG